MCAGCTTIKKEKNETPIVKVKNQERSKAQWKTAPVTKTTKYEPGISSLALEKRKRLVGYSNSGDYGNLEVAMNSWIIGRDILAKTPADLMFYSRIAVAINSKTKFITINKVLKDYSNNYHADYVRVASRAWSHLHDWEKCLICSRNLSRENTCEYKYLRAGACKHYASRLNRAYPLSRKFTREK